MIARLRTAEADAGAFAIGFWFGVLVGAIVGAVVTGAAFLVGLAW